MRQDTPSRLQQSFGQKTTSLRSKRTRLETLLTWRVFWVTGAKAVADANSKAVTAAVNFMVDSKKALVKEL